MTGMAMMEGAPMPPGAPPTGPAPMGAPPGGPAPGMGAPPPGAGGGFQSLNPETSLQAMSPLMQLQQQDLAMFTAMQQQALMVALQALMQMMPNPAGQMGQTETGLPAEPTLAGSAGPPPAEAPPEDAAPGGY